MRTPVAPPKPELEAERIHRERVAGLTSFVLHVTAALAMALWIVAPEGRDGGPVVVIQADRAAPAPVPEMLRLSAPEAPSVAAAAEAPAVLETPDPLAVELHVPALPSSQAASQPLGALESPLAAALASPLPALPTNRAASGKGRGGGASYFGIYAEGERFVYIVDCSTSMKGSRWQTACRELRGSLARLTPECSFYVLFFSDQTHLMFRDSLAEVQFLPADMSTVRRARRWIGSIPLGDQTRPLHSLQIALQMQPDAIFLLSDGEFRDRSLEYIRLVADQIETPIHTIALFSHAGRVGLEEIAARTGGEFRFITR